MIENTLQSLVEQTFQDFEVVIVDDGSTDDTALRIEKYNKSLNLGYIYKENGGKHTAVNVGLENAQGFFFLVVDAKCKMLPDAFENIKKLWDEIEDKSSYSGVMGRCVTTGGETIGRPFPQDIFISSYVDFHFISGVKNGGYGDCCETVRTDIMKNYRWPESNLTKFVPERYIYDKIGIKYKMLCTNTIFKEVEYLSDGVTMNARAHMRKNAVGFLWDCISKIDEIFPSVKGIPLKTKFKQWVKYWCLLRVCGKTVPDRVKKRSFLGFSARVCSMFVRI